MGRQVEHEPEGKKNGKHILVLAAALVLPSVLWIVFGWTSFFLPLLLFVFIHKYGWRYTNSHLIFAVPAALVGSLVFDGIELALFACAFIPCGYTIAYCAERRLPPSVCGAAGTAAAAVSLSIFFLALLPEGSGGLFATMGQVFEKVVDDALQHYRNSSDYSAESYVMVEQTLLQLKESVPAILPAIFCSFLMVVNWGTLVMANGMLPRIGSVSPWIQFQYWQLPDKLIWFFIGAAAAVAAGIGQETAFSVNILLILTVPYVFQGLAVTVYWLGKWNVPRFIRVFIYVMVVLQSFGTVALIIVGIADVWFDFRKIRNTPSPPEQQ